MRHSNHANRGHRRPDRAVCRGVPAAAIAWLALLALVAAACGPSAAAPSSPTAVATPAPTPDPHLKAPVTADQIYNAIASAQLGLYPNNALLDQGTIVKRINADLNGWPIRITAYDSVSAADKAAAWKAGQAPGRGEPPYAFVALNVIVEYGPITGAAPASPDPDHQATAVQLVGILDPLLWPIEQHSVMAIPARTITPRPTASPKPPKATPRPSAKPSKRP